MSLRSNDIRLLREQNVPPAVIRMLEVQNEDIRSCKKLILEMANQMNRLADHLMVVQKGIQAVGMANDMKRVGVQVGSDPTLTGEHDE